MPYVAIVFLCFVLYAITRNPVFLVVELVALRLQLADLILDRR